MQLLLLKGNSATCPTKQFKQHLAQYKNLNKVWVVQINTKQPLHFNVATAARPAPMQVIPKLQIRSTKNQLGISYIEIMIVVVILAIVAIVAMPNSSPTDTRKLDIAAEEIAQAIRFARLEAIRTATPYGVEFNSTNNTVKVYSLVYSEFFGIPIWTPTFNIYHPVDKKLYTLNIKTDSATTGVDLYSYSIFFVGSATNRQNLGFNSNGIPKYSSGGTDSMLNGSATITLSFIEQTRLISVAPMTGRVTVQ